jgi:aspartyl-tRNA(Asn)/glutamyl-tRNA(Gln) amidotransferase subunit A
VNRVPSNALADLSALELRAAYAAREASPVEAVAAVAERIAECDPSVNAYTTLTLDAARERAAAAEREYAAGEGRPLAGIPLGVKDLLDTAGVRTTYGSAIFAGHVPDADATAVRRALDAGAISIGKTLTHEFAWGITCDNPHFGSCRNPWAPDRVAGGSSGGSAAALAYGGCALALGSDTGGSIRIPAAFCGVVGMKPTRGLVSTAGVFPLARSLDHAGPLARTPADARLLLSAIAGPDAADPMTATQPPGAAALDADGSLDGWRVAVCADLDLNEPSPDVRRALDRAVAALADLGAELVEAPFPSAEEIRPAFAAIQRAEALSAHRHAGLYPDRRADYGADVLAHLEAAERVSLDDYLRALESRRRIRADFAALLERADLLVTPVSAGPPAAVGEKTVPHLGTEVPFRDLVLGCTTPQDLAGLPACALRAGFDGDGIPIGVQLTGPPWRDARVLAAAEALFDATPPVQERRPPVGARAAG